MENNNILRMNSRNKNKNFSLLEIIYSNNHFTIEKFD